MSTDTLEMFPELLRQPADVSTTGLLPSQRLEEMIGSGQILASAPISQDQIQPSSIDLRLGPVAYHVRASFLPGPNATVQRKLQTVRIEEIDLSTPALLEKGTVYIVPLHEELRLPASYSAKANPKSTTGRLDVFIRLITDYGDAFDEIREGYKGRLYAEIVPLTFRVLVREGNKLNQLRIRRGDPPQYDKTLRELHEREPIVYLQDASPAEPVIRDGLKLSVDLQGVNGSNVIGYRAKKEAPPVDLARVNYYDPADFWEPLYRSPENSVVLKPGDFYILTSKEKVSVPPHMAAEMLPFDPSVGEFRIHYAGFFDPGFGWSSERTTGSHAVLEVRSHEVPSLLEDGQVVGRLNYERLLATPAKLYGQQIGSSYQAQQLTLSKQFKRS
ncbi:MAG: 2'-deoxycytidine 5'-triphosphate deaminase [Bryobacteraceae bacterium]